VARTRRQPPTDIDDPRYLKALAHPTRIRVLAMLREQRASPVELSARLGESLGTVAYHVRTLKGLGLIKLVATRQRRGATEHIYEAVADPQFTAEAWDRLGPVDKQRMLSAQLREAGEYAAGSAAAGGFDRADATIVRESMTLDEKGWTAMAKAGEKWLAEAQRIQEAASKRLEKNGADAVDAGLILMLFETRRLSDAKADAKSGS
jgi:DNA-binding transcriptional ArsR family regulator